MLHFYAYFSSCDFDFCSAYGLAIINHPIILMIANDIIYMLMPEFLKKSCSKF